MGLPKGNHSFVEQGEQYISQIPIGWNSKQGREEGPIIMQNLWLWNLLYGQQLRKELIGFKCLGIHKWLTSGCRVLTHVKTSSFIVFFMRDMSKSAFPYIYFQHIYRKRNTRADGLSKGGLQLDPGGWHIWEELDSHTSFYNHASFY